MPWTQRDALVAAAACAAVAAGVALWWRSRGAVATKPSSGAAEASRRRRKAPPLPDWVSAPGGPDPPALPEDVTATLKAKYGIDARRGFLPPEDPLVRSAIPAMAPLEDAIAALTDMLHHSDPADTRLAIDQASEAAAEAGVEEALRDPSIGQPEARRALHVAAHLANAFVWCGGADDVATRLPNGLARALIAAGEAVGTHPALSHCSSVLVNWRRSAAIPDAAAAQTATHTAQPAAPDAAAAADGGASGAAVSAASDCPDEEPLRAKDLTMLNGFLNTPDEAWFFLITVELEWAGRCLPGQLLAILRNASALANALSAKGVATSAASRGAAADDGGSAVTPTELVRDSALRLRAVARALYQMTTTLGRMNEGCSPDAFYTSVRPFLAGSSANPALPGGLIYGDADGLDASGKPVTRQYFGGSAAQSSLVQSVDAALGIAHSGSGLSDAVSLALAAASSSKSSGADAVDEAAAKELSEAFAAAVSALDGFRAGHMGIVSEYILEPQSRLRKAAAEAEAATVAAPAAPAAAGGGGAAAASSADAVAASPGAAPPAEAGTTTISTPARAKRAGAGSSLSNTSGGKGTGGTDIVTFLMPLREATRAVLDVIRW
ncbi:hypothetical protein FNF29_07708 [Cafeteria roenbergensis]|uniref:Uncharacterized protein n=1 Tax=Cafeteria roenbergensis TaxID=33653 RepID=A0A5A8C515_CAFRO|nr:hypothetical protein FNF29_07708 [Cafeteria roenbergensis]|eukprot:KAA0146971.1 hypothetical protein FNF29_07708 [Cafeteria roenbergensis]